MLLPDLTPWLSESRGFGYGWTIQGNELRLTSAIANIGTGALELRGGESTPDGQNVYQRIYEADGTYTDALAGTFTYHPEHAHIHFDEFAEFRLREVLPDGSIGDVVASGDKVSFCLLDVERYDATGPSARQYLTCGQVQGISVGWADVYDSGLPGQSIDISGIADGTYFLEVAVDPSDLLVEFDETNNAAGIQIVIDRSGTGNPGSDTFEPNDSFATASILAPPEDHTYEDLTIHEAFNDDYFRVTASAAGTLALELSFLHGQGDIDMEVFDTNQTFLARSESVSNTELVSLAATTGEEFFVRVYGYDGAINPNYTLNVDQPGGSSPSDPFEDNDSFATAALLSATDQTQTGLSIDAPGDDDYYAITPENSGTMTVGLAFQHAAGDIDLRVFNGAQTQLGQSESVSNTEQVSVQVTAGETYFVRAYGYNGAVNTDYTLTLDVPEGGTGGPQGDRFEDNDSFATAALLPAADQTETGLSIDAPGDDDYYAITPENSGTMTVGLAFQHAAGDIDLRVFNGAQTQLGQSNSVSNTEQVSVQVTAGETYFVRAYGYSGAVNTDYTLTLDVPEGGTGGPQGDRFEDNDSFATAALLPAADQTETGLSIDAPGDDDYYAVTATTSGQMTIGLAFQHAAGDIDLRVFNGAQTQLGLSRIRLQRRADCLPGDRGRNIFRPRLWL